MAPLIEPLQFLKDIHQNGVRYLLIGRQAVIAYGGPVQSMDYDIFIDSSEENLDKLLAIAKKYELLPSLAKDQISKHFKFRLENDFIVDVFRAKTLAISKSQKVSFTDLFARKEVLKGEEGLELNLPSIDDLILLKKLRSSPKDLQDIAYLKALKK
jgi:hypothetical protein